MRNSASEHRLTAVIVLGLESTQFIQCRGVDAGTRLSSGDFGVLFGQAAFREVMKPADLRYFDHLAERRRLDGPTDGGIFVERQMSPAMLVVFEILLQHPTQANLAENDDVIQAFTADRPNEPLGVAVLPRGLRSSEDFVDAHPLRGFAKPRPIGPISVAQQITRCAVPGKSPKELLPCPFRGGMRGDSKMSGTPAVMGQHHENEQHFERDRWNYEEVSRHNIFHMILKKGAPGL